MPSHYPIQGEDMKIKNIGTANFVVKDIRGNVVTLEPSCVIEIDDAKGKKLTKIYSTLQEVKEAKKEVVEVKEVKEKPVDVPRETKKKRKK